MKNRIKSHYSTANIEKSALRYISKFGTTQAHLIKFLQQKILKNFIVEDKEELKNHIQQVVARLTKVGFVNDMYFCESRIKSLLKAGNPFFMISLKLNQKGITPQIFNNALESISLQAEESLPYAKEELEQYALLKYAYTKRAIPWQHLTLQDDSRKILNKLANRGFSFSLIERTLSCDNIWAQSEEDYQEYLQQTETKYSL